MNAVAVDAYTPAAMRERVSEGAAAKANTPASRTFALAVLAGTYAWVYRGAGTA